MNVSPPTRPDLRRRLHFALVAILASIVIAMLIATGAVSPYPNLKFAYLICVAVGVSGFIKLVVVISSRLPNK